MAPNTPKIWLITGSSSGLGLEICLAAQEAGHIVIASSRSPSKTPGLVARIEARGGAWIELDVMSSALEAQLAKAVGIHGRIDVLVNNAGFAASSTIEDTPIELAQSIMATNYLGPLRTCKAIIPTMRGAGSGTIVNVSSAEGVCATPTLACYTASKHALEGLTKTLVAEVAAFGIRVLLAAPGEIRTNLNAAGTLVPVSESYGGGICGVVQQHLLDRHGRQVGDPAKMARRIVEAVDGTGLVGRREGMVRLPLGMDVGGRIGRIGQSMVDEAKNLEDIWKSTDFDGL
ncbi:putative short chain oxidoreductase/dehydrogenase [Glonium stellatum]|uniref:Putative short chain oxidoreductase/dehydrogenase n=1 Tax=Glonium stellatum TaxID=574774 RepID=A0A8E2EXH7_9PEZI|nr:putative short chain oxidoreductase/dehydrogenase [Glonium stellatum]